MYRFDRAKTKLVFFASPLYLTFEKPKILFAMRKMCPAPDLMDSIKRRYTGDQRGAAEDGQILHAGFQT